MAVSWLQRAALIWRDSKTNLDPTSGANKPKKPELRVWGSQIEGLVETADNARIVGAGINGSSHLILTRADGTTIDVGVVGGTGPSGSATSNSAFALTGVLTPASIAADQDDYNPSGLSTASTLVLTATAASPRINSMYSPGGDGDIKALVNAGQNPIVITDAAATGAASRRFAIPGGDITLRSRETLLVRYDGALSRWRPWGQAKAPQLAPLTVPPASTRIAAETVLPSGHRLWGVDRQVPAAPGPQEGRDGVAIRNGVHLDNTLRNAATTTAYTGGLGNPYLWLKRPLVGADLKPNLLVNLSRLPDEAMWEPAVLDTSGLAINPAWASKYVVLIIQMGNSFGRGGPSAPLTAQVISVSAVDPGWALMTDLTNVTGDLPSLPSTGGRWADDPRDMGAYAPGATAGEAPLTSMAKILSASMLARGSKLKTWTAGYAQGGHRLVELMRGFVPLVASEASGIPGGTGTPGAIFDSRPGGIYEAALAGLQKMADWCRRNDLIPILGPLIMQHGANDALARTTGRKYAQLLQKMLADFNEDAKAILGLSPFAPDVPMVIVQDSTKSPVLQPSTGVRIFSPDATTPSMAQWALSRIYPEKFILSTAEYPWTVGPDNIHKVVSGYYREGEVIAPTVDRTMWGKPLRQGLKGIVRVSPTETQLFFNGGAWQFGTDGQITPPADGAKGVVAWRVGSPGTPISLSSVDLHADEARVVVTHEALTGGPTARIAFDIAQWANDDAPATCGGPVLGPRSTLRLKTPMPSTLPEWNDPNTGSPFSAVDNFLYVPPARAYATEDTGSYYAVDGDIL